MPWDKEKRKEYLRSPKGRAYRVRAALRRIARNYEVINAYKMGRGCIDCGYKEHPVALEFDHVRGTKKAGIANLMLRSIHSIMKEIEKCDVRCANCHNIRSWKDNPLRKKYEWRDGATNDDS
jgi:hypothetical protein